MKKAIVIAGLVFFPFLSNGQNLILSVAPTINGVHYFRFVTGGAAMYPNFGFHSSVNFIPTKGKKFVFGFGLNYQFSRVKFRPEITDSLFMPEAFIESANLISICFKSVINLKNESFISLDPNISLHIKSTTQESIDNQSGLGISIGYGKRIPASESLRINIESRLWVYDIIPFIAKDLPRRLTVLGLKVGICFNI